jgi:diguanylate cyclase (GGDEF)-like protein/PAS domain S-box-containing protein
VVLLDVMLPDASGLDVARQLKGDPALADVFVILFSGTKVSPDDQARGLAEGLADGYMVRPLSKRELLARIEAFLRIRQTQRELRESEAKYRDVVERASDGIAILQGGLVVFANEALASMSGYSVGELTGMSFLAGAHAVRHEIEERVRRRLAGEDEPSAYESDLVRKDGTPFTAEVSAGVIAYKGAPADLVLLRDVSERKAAQAELRESEERYRGLFEDSDAVMLLIDPRSGAIVDANPAACAWYGWSRDEMLAMRIEQINTLSQSEVAAEMAAARARSRRVFFFKHRRADGSIRDVEVYSGPIDLQGKTLLYSTVHDITERKLAEDALRESEERFEAIAEYSASWEAWFSPQGRLLWMNQYSVDLTGFTPEDYMAAEDSLSMAIAEEDRAWVVKLFLEALQGGSGDNAEMRVLRKDGSRFWASVSWRPILDADGGSLGFRASARDITDSKRAEEARVRLNDKLVAEAAALVAANATITRIAASDVLTGLANRRHFYESLERAVSLARRHGSPLALVALDLDGLKRVNDSAGHEAGDEVLASFAALLAELCRAEDLPARLGGDEFCVLLSGIDLGGAQGLAERVLATVRASAALAQRGVTVSAGVAQWTPDELPDDLLRRADGALYTAKRLGGDAVSAQD